MFYESYELSIHNCVWAYELSIHNCVWAYELSIQNCVWAFTLTVRTDIKMASMGSCESMNFFENMLDLCIQ